MRIFKKVCASLLAIGLLVGVFYLGILSGKDNKYVVWFGIASAIAAPIALSLLGFVFAGSESEVIEQLAKVPEIENLIQKAKTHEEKIKLLEKEQSRLAEIVKLESRHYAAKDRIESLEQDAVRILQELDNLEQELVSLNKQVGQSSVSKEIKRLRERVKARESGDVFLKLGKRTYRFDRDIIKALPFGLGNLTLAYLRILEHISKRF